MPRYTERDRPTGRASWPNPSRYRRPVSTNCRSTEKIDYLQSLWDRIAATPETIPVPDWHREVLDERLKDLDADPGAGDSWDAVQERLRKKFERSH